MQTSGWTPPEHPGAAAGPVGPPAGTWQASVPLGGAVPVDVPPEVRSDRRDVVVAGFLLVGAVLSALASLWSWRDYGPALDPDENGWTLANGALGRGWVAVLLAAVLAVGGVLLMMGRRRAGRVWARVGSLGLVVFAAVEWAFGGDGARTGPGAGLWALLAVGAALVVLVGTVLPADDPEPAERS